MVNKIKKRYNEIPLTVKVSTSYAVCSILQKCWNIDDFFNFEFSLWFFSDGNGKV